MHDLLLLLFINVGLNGFLFKLTRILSIIFIFSYFRGFINKYINFAFKSFSFCLLNGICTVLNKFYYSYDYSYREYAGVITGKIYEP